MATVPSRRRATPILTSRRHSRVAMFVFVSAWLLVVAATFTPKGTFVTSPATIAATR